MSTRTGLHERLKALGVRWRAVPARLLGGLKAAIEALRAEGKTDPGIHAEYLSKFEYEAPAGFGNGASVVVAAVPQGISLVTFRLPDRPRKAVIPPTYIFRKTRALLEGALRNASGGLRVERARLPLKLLAVASGLGRYGKNGLAYVEGMGSFARLEAFFVDIRLDASDDRGVDADGGPLDAREWREGLGRLDEIRSGQGVGARPQGPRRTADALPAYALPAAALPSCEGCTRCADNCPTGCLGETLVVDAARCLTYFNESPRSFPGFVDRKAHNALVGCVRCQTVCPENRPYMRTGAVAAESAAAAFDEEETSMILANRPDGTRRLAEKLRELDMDEYGDVLCRNLTLLMNR
jgi:epoxyqueuosine reductase